VALTDDLTDSLSESETSAKAEDASCRCIRMIGRFRRSSHDVKPLLAFIFHCDKLCPMKN
jgi:hypothetical protein